MQDLILLNRDKKINIFLEYKYIDAKGKMHYITNRAYECTTSGRH